MLLVLSLLACRGGVIDQEPEETDLPSEYILEEEEPPTPNYSVAELAAAAQEALDAILTLNAYPVMDSYSAAMVGQDDSCPNYYATEGGVYWYDQCTASTGTQFYGYGFEIIYDDETLEGYTYNGHGVFGAATVKESDGDLFQAAGTAYWIEYDSDETQETEHTIFQSIVQGTFSWTGEEANETWMLDGLSPDLYLYAYIIPESDSHYMYVDGGVSGLGQSVDAVVFDEMQIYDETLGSNCSIEPSGSISIRGDDGHWYDVLFDGPSSEQPITSPEDCDGCGAAYFRGEPMGEACLTFDTLLDWESKPW